MLSARLPAQLHDQLARSAQAHDRSVSAECREAIREHLSAKDLSWDDKGDDGLSSGRRPPSAGGQP
jgi:plasmid stability protein